MVPTTHEGLSKTYTRNARREEGTGEEESEEADGTALKEYERRVGLDDSCSSSDSTSL